jgi:hypothetical protein
MATREILEEFVNAINSARADRLSPLMTRDHVFIDSLGARLEGRTAVVEGWRSYFRLFPDYRIEVQGWFLGDDETSAMLHGRASGTLHRDTRPVEGGRWEIPAAWRASTDARRVTSWQVYADNKPVYALLGG